MLIKIVRTKDNTLYNVDHLIETRSASFIKDEDSRVVRIEVDGNKGFTLVDGNDEGTIEIDDLTFLQVWYNNGVSYEQHPKKNT